MTDGSPLNATKLFFLQRHTYYDSFKGGGQQVQKEKKNLLAFLPRALSRSIRNGTELERESCSITRMEEKVSPILKLNVHFSCCFLLLTLFSSATYLRKGSSDYFFSF